MQNSVKLHETNCVKLSNNPVEFISILSNGIDQNPVTEITEQLHVSFKTSDEFTDEEHSLFNYNIADRLH